MKLRLKWKRKYWIFVIAALVLIAAAAVTAGIVKSQSAGKKADVKTEEQSEKEEQMFDKEDEPEYDAGEDDAGQGDREVTEVEVESEELSEEDVEQLNKELEGNTATSHKSPYYIKVNRLANCVTVYGKDANGEYTVPVKAMICSVGKDINDTPTGVFGTYAKYTWRYLFGEQYGQYTTRIVGHILFHSVPYTKPEKDMLRTDYYNNLGIGDSMGCIRLTVADAKWIYDNCPLGTTVEIYDDLNPGPLGKPTAIHIDPSSPYAGWDPTDPDSGNPWLYVDRTPAFSGVKNITAERGSTVTLTQGVTASDFCGNTLDVMVSGSVNTAVCGQYPITYTVTDAMGNTASATAVVSVVDTTPPTISQTKDITVYDSTADLANLIKSALSAVDLSQKLDSASISVDTSALDTARANRSYGTVYCTAYATDGSGNKSSVLQVKVSYVFKDEKAPEIAVKESPEITVEISGDFIDETKKKEIQAAAVSKVKEGKCFTVTDNETAVDKIVLNYEAAGLEMNPDGAGAKVIVTVTATDASGNSSAANISVSVRFQETAAD